jgi:hypothetical protein
LIATSAPCRAASTAAAAPMPVDPPVIRTRFPASNVIKLSPEISLKSGV